jgi:hypothetical protein
MTTTYRIIPSAFGKRSGTQVVDGDGNRIRDVVCATWIHRAGDLPRIVVELYADQEEPLTAEADGTIRVHSDPERRL